MKYKLVALGGTFDLLHRGHRSLLNKAFNVGEKVIIGLANFKLKKTINFKAQRIKELTDYLKSQNFWEHAEIVDLKNPYGPTVDDPNYEVLVVSEDTQYRANEINDIRKSKGFKPLEIIVVPMVKDQNGEIISSRRIRAGEIDRNGNCYKNLFKQTIIISQKLRNELKRPQGEMIREKEIKGISLTKEKRIGKAPLVILVGDAATRRFLDEKINYDIAIVDLKVARAEMNLFSEKFHDEDLKYLVKNKPGTISKELAEAIFKTIKTGEGVVRIIGEEDLGAVCAVLLSPLNSLVFYGQPKYGIVMIEVTEKKKEKYAKLVHLERCSNGLIKKGCPLV